MRRKSIIMILGAFLLLALTVVILLPDRNRASTDLVVATYVRVDFDSLLSSDPRFSGITAVDVRGTDLVRITTIAATTEQARADLKIATNFLVDWGRDEANRFHLKSGADLYAGAVEDRGDHLEDLTWWGRLTSCVGGGFP
jgi:hypothetical protein